MITNTLTLDTNKSYTTLDMVTKEELKTITDDLTKQSSRIDSIIEDIELTQIHFDARMDDITKGTKNAIDDVINRHYKFTLDYHRDFSNLFNIFSICLVGIIICIAVITAANIIDTTISNSHLANYLITLGCGGMMGFLYSLTEPIKKLKDKHNKYVTVEDIMKEVIKQMDIAYDYNKENDNENESSRDP